MRKNKQRRERSTRNPDRKCRATASWVGMMLSLDQSSTVHNSASSTSNAHSSSYDIRSVLLSFTGAFHRNSR